MNRPIKHNGKWRIRWVDHTGKRQSRVYRTKPMATKALKGVEKALQLVRDIGNAYDLFIFSAIYGDILPPVNYTMDSEKKKSDNSINLGVVIPPKSQTAKLHGKKTILP